MNHLTENIRHVTLDGQTLRIEQVVAVARFGARVSLSPKTFERIDASRALVDRIVEEGRTVYGISTGFGEFSKITISSDKSAQLQENLILSHCVAVGEPLNEETARAMMLLRANALSKGNSGIRREIIETLIGMLNKGVHPVIPEQGSLGASGDLAPLAHMALVLLGRGEAIYKGKRMSGAEAMAKAKLPTFHLLAKEGLALINGTQCMTAIGTLAWYDLNRGAQLADITASMTMQALTGLLSAFDPRIHAVRPHAGQALVAKNMRTICADSPSMERNRNLRVQDAYALRCIPQVHGAVKDNILYVKSVIENEINSATDNPNIFPDEDMVISAGNFHGEPIAIPMDSLAIAMSELASISERRTYQLIHGLRGLPKYLVTEPGLNSGFMIPQYTAASIVSQNKGLCWPASCDSIPSSQGQEDHVSMGSNSATKLVRVVDNTETVLAIELFNAAQALEFRRPLKSSPALEKVFEAYRKEVPFVEQDTYMHPLIVKSIEFLHREEFLQ